MNKDEIKKLYCDIHKVMSETIDIELVPLIKHEFGATYRIVGHLKSTEKIMDILKKRGLLK